VKWQHLSLVSLATIIYAIYVRILSRSSFEREDRIAIVDEFYSHRLKLLFFGCRLIAFVFFKHPSNRQSDFVFFTSGTQAGGGAFYQLQADDAGVTVDIETNNNITVFSAYLWIDTDADGIPDDWETTHGLNAGSAAAGGTGAS
jgi:hypothetical protein